MSCWLSFEWALINATHDPGTRRLTELRVVRSQARSAIYLMATIYHYQACDHGVAEKCVPEI